MAEEEQQPSERRARRRAPAGPSMPVAPETVVPRAAPAITATGLSKRFGSLTAVDGFSFEVATGSVVGFVGPNGAGKTTTIRMLMGLIRPDAGQATVLGEPISYPARYLGGAGAIIEEPGFYPGLSGTKNLLVQCRLRGLDADRIPATITAVGLEDAASRNFGGHSLGMRKRLAIAGALLGNPRLLVLDEPANGLDHLLSEVEQACDEVVVVQKGRLAFQGRLDDLLSTSEAEIVASAENPAQHRALRKLCLDAGFAAEQRGERVHVHVRAPSSFAGELNRMAAAKGITLVELRRERLDLERVFFELTESAGIEEATHPRTPTDPSGSSSPDRDCCWACPHRWWQPCCWRRSASSASHRSRASAPGAEGDGSWPRPSPLPTGGSPA